MPLPVPADSASYTAIRGCIGLALLIVGAVGLMELIIALGTPRREAQIREELAEAGFVNAAHIPPMLFSIRKADSGHIYEFDTNNMPLALWERDKDKIGAALNCQVTSVNISPNGRRVLVHGISMRSTLPERIYWKDQYLSSDDFVLVLGMGLTGELATVDLASMPHLLIGGGSGSGKSCLFKSLLMQGIKKDALVILADMKGGIDYPSVWRKRCKMVFDLQALPPVLDELVIELERRRKLFVEAGASNLAEYNKITGENLPRYIFACDEVAEILDTTGLDRAEKGIIAQIIKHLSLIARQGRAFGLHLFFATQRPSAELIPGQIRTNLGLRICGRADDILSRIILDSTAAAEQIPLDAQGRFTTNTGVIFQGFLFDDSILEQ